MAKNNLLLVDLNDDKTKKLAETITSDTSRKILNYLAEKEDSEANIAKSTGIPISTVHYHLLKLQDAGLVLTDEYHYSEKGREINHYKLANKYIIIAPKKVTGLKQKLKNILPVAIVTFATAAMLKLFSSGRMMSSTFKSASIKEATVMTDSAPELMNVAAPIAQNDMYIVPYPDIALWFLIGAVSAMITYLVYSIIKDWIKNRN